MKLFEAKRQREALAKLGEERQAQIAAEALELLQQQPPEQRNVSLLFDMIKLDNDQSSEYKYIFAKSFFNVQEKPISAEQIAVCEELGVTPTPELDFSQVMIPETQDQYEEAYKNATREILKAVNKNNPKIPLEDRLEKAKQALTSKDSVIADFKFIDEDTYSTLVKLSNLKIISKATAKAKAKAKATGKAESTEPLTNSGAPQDPLTPLTPLTPPIPPATKAPIPAYGDNNASSPGGRPSTSPKSPNASCLGGLAEAVLNIFSRSAGNSNNRGGR